MTVVGREKTEVAGSSGLSSVRPVVKCRLGLTVGTVRSSFNPICQNVTQLWFSLLTRWFMRQWAYGVSIMVSSWQSSRYIPFSSKWMAVLYHVMLYKLVKEVNGILSLFFTPRGMFFLLRFNVVFQLSSSEQKWSSVSSSALFHSGWNLKDIKQIG